MNWLEVLLALGKNLSCIFFIAGIISGIIIAILLVICIVDMADCDGNLAKKLFDTICTKILPLTILCSVIACVPTIEDIWKVRIGLIKLQLASPENIQKGADEIVRIGKKLECKYVGCDEEKEKSK